jgi:hypothetical protein
MSTMRTRRTHSTGSGEPEAAPGPGDPRRPPPGPPDRPRKIGGSPTHIQALGLLSRTRRRILRHTFEHPGPSEPSGHPEDVLSQDIASAPNASASSGLSSSRVTSPWKQANTIVPSWSSQWTAYVRSSSSTDSSSPSNTATSERSRGANARRSPTTASLCRRLPVAPRQARALSRLPCRLRVSLLRGVTGGRLGQPTGVRQ